MGIPSIVNWLGDVIDEGDAHAALYVAEINQHPELITISYCPLVQVEQLQSISYLGRLRYITCADPEICEKRTSLSLKDCWLGEQFLLYQLSDYREILPYLQEVETQKYTEIFKLPESGASRFIEWIAETSQKIFCNPKSGYKLCLDSLVTTSRQRLLYEQLKMQWSNDL
ncbi:hypothetical protein SynBIOSE41_02389 [Synechococcus sp. BIOS-E4-1]|uniref:hypothetical protein n=1 Tax=Synechococcus sp. BIOS-E4-1 TaxID=1400864 RepID=UPI001645AAB6|nr:hypothetical protein [Synechococcus sp. BIOS-E4-1]QNI54888.1 hypothetical protein SynBIOSE41_02389 [Synechococcus sp. BIOS-E4-1]